MGCVLDEMRRGKRSRDALSLDTLCDFCCHPRIHLDGCDMFCFFENPNRQISSTRTDLKDFVCGTKVRLEGNVSSEALRCVVVTYLVYNSNATKRK